MVPMPTLIPRMRNELAIDREGNTVEQVDHLHFSLIHNGSIRKRCAFVVAVNILQDDDAAKRDAGQGWSVDQAVDISQQIEDAYFRRGHSGHDNLWSRGHLAMRENVSWSLKDDDNEREKASDGTFVWTNCALMHDKYNGGKWLKLEQWIGNKAKTESYDSEKLQAFNKRVCTFTGPIYPEKGRREYLLKPVHTPRHVDGKQEVIVPEGFFKVICYKNLNDELETRAFVMLQDLKENTDVNAVATAEADLLAAPCYETTTAYVESLTLAWCLTNH